MSSSRNCFAQLYALLYLTLIIPKILYIYIWINYWLTRASLCLVAHFSWHLFPRVIISFSTLRVSSTFNYTTYTITHSRDLQNNSKKWHTNLLGWITKIWKTKVNHQQELPLSPTKLHTISQVNILNWQ